MLTPSDLKIKELQSQVNRLEAMVQSLYSQFTAGQPSGGFDPNSITYATITGYGVNVLGNGVPGSGQQKQITVNFSNIATPVSLTGKTLQGGVPVQLQGVQFYAGVYQ